MADQPLSLRVVHEPEAAHAEDASPRHLSEWLAVLYRYQAMIATIFGGAVALAVLVTLLTPHRYTAETRLEVVQRSPIQLRLQDSVVRVAEGDTSRDAALTFLATQLAVLRSRDLAERVIRERRLVEGDELVQTDARLGGAGTVSELLRPRGWEMTSAAAAASPELAVHPDVIDRYAKVLAVRDVKGTDLIEVSFTTASPALSAFLAAAHTQAYMDANDEVRRRTDELARGFLDRQAAESQERIVTAEAALGRFAAAHPRTAANQEQKTGEQRLTELSTNLTKYETQRLALESRYHFLTQPDTEALPYFLDRPGIQKLRLELLTAKAQRAGVSQRLGPNHPQMLDLRQLETELGRQVETEVRQEMAAVRMHYDAARAREDRLRRRLAQEERRAGKQRELGARYELLKGEVETARTLHTSLRKQRMDTAVNADLAATNVRVIERPEVPKRPSRPNIPLNLTIGMAAGLVLSIGAAFARDYFDDTVKSPEEMEEILHVPTLAAIPAFDALPARAAAAALPAAPQSELVVVREPWSGVAEAFRGVRTALLLSGADEPPRVTLVTSAGAGEGKTMASLNLALALAQAGARVILVDADLRHPRAHTALGAANDAGLSSVLLGRTALPNAVQTIEEPPLALLPAGPVPSNPSELLGSARMGMLLTHLRDAYDFVIVDTPPVLAVTDAVLLARDADGVILVVKGEHTPRALVRRARDRLTLAGTRVLGVVVNNVNARWSNVYYGYPGFEGC
jgi:capsular exopolysaccharide synthesis family protein